MFRRLQPPQPDALPPDKRLRLDAEWLFLNAVREAICIAGRVLKPPSYDDTIQAAAKLAPQLFDAQSSLLLRDYESIYAREFRQKASALSKTQGISVSPIKLIDEEIESLRELAKHVDEDDGLRKRIRSLTSARAALTQKKLTENKLINWDAIRLERRLPISGYGADYQEYALPDGRAIRIRALHPDRPEQTTGADVIYEYYRTDETKVRLAVVQYKVWNGERLSISKTKRERIEKQLGRMQAAFCQQGICRSIYEEVGGDPYRMPCCTAFLRPTDQLLNPDSRLASSAYHIPVCKLAQFWHETSQGGKYLLAEEIREQAITTQTFDELFNNNMLGSRWLRFRELEELYHEYRIMETDERIVLHVQDVALEISEDS